MVLGKNSRGKKDLGKNRRWKKWPMEKTADGKNSGWKKQPIEKKADGDNT